MHSMLLPMLSEMYFQYFYNPLDGALDLFTNELMFVVVVVLLNGLRAA